MQENARQGFFNGSRPHFGFQAVEAETRGNEGQCKKRIVVDMAEAAIVRRIFKLYLRGDNGAPLGGTVAQAVAGNLGDSAGVPSSVPKWLSN